MLYSRKPRAKLDLFIFVCFGYLPEFSHSEVQRLFPNLCQVYTNITVHCYNARVYRICSARFLFFLFCREVTSLVNTNILPYEKIQYLILTTSEQHTVEQASILKAQLSKKLCLNCVCGGAVVLFGYIGYLIHSGL